MSSAGILRAMAANYANGHSWDQLDSEACLNAATRIEQLEAENAALREEVDRFRTGFDRFLRSCEECTDQDGWLAFMCSADDFHEAQSVLEEGENDET